MHKNRVHLGLCVALSLLTLCGLLTTPAITAESQAKVEPTTGELAEAIAVALSMWLPDPLRERGVPGAAAAVVDKERIIWEQTYGVTGEPGSAPITPHTIFCIRSISKSVTALGVLMAVQEGLVDLDTPVSEYLPGFTVHSRFDAHPEDLITLRHMLAS